MGLSVADANRVWSAIERRAEKAEGQGTLAQLIEIDEVNPIFDPTTMVLFGRRGAGKTHTLLHLLAKVRRHGDVGVYIDMRKVSSNAGIYDDEDIEFGTRATNMLVDVVSEVHEELYRLAVLGEDQMLSQNLAEVGLALDALGEAVTAVRVTGETTVRHDSHESGWSEKRRKQVLKVSKKPALGFESGSISRRASERARTESHTGRARIYIHLGKLDEALRRLVAAMEGHRLWLLIDEWSAGVPYELQPVLADMLRRTFVSTPSVVVKIAAIEHRAKFIEDAENVEYVGLELGSDTGESLSLDSKLVITIDPSPSVAFMRQLLIEHFRAAAPGLISAEFVDAINLCFAPKAFENLVLASEGNPRDAINLVSRAARRAREQRISIEDVLRASEDYFWNTKYKNIEGDKNAEALFEEFASKSLERRVRTVLFARSDTRRRSVDKLYDRRLIHLVRAGLRPIDDEGIYDAYAVDFGAYADRILRKEMRWANDGFASPLRFHLDSATEPWKDAVVRRTKSRAQRR